MNYLSGAFRYVARGETEKQNNVPRLVDRIMTSALPHDRRTAIIHLTEAAKLSPQRQVEVGELGLKVLYAVLEQDVDYDETIKAALDLLIAICGRLDPPRLPENASQDPAQEAKAVNANKQFLDGTAKAAATNVDVFLGMPNALSLLLQLLEKGDFYVKFGTIELLTAMAANSRQTLQMAVLEAAQGVARICDLLDDAHRHIRSNAVLLLSTLCEDSPEICKIIAFGGVLEKLFSLIDAVISDSGEGRNVSEDDIDDEDSLEAAIVIQDVLLVVRNLIAGAKTTKTFFRDSGFLQRLVTVIEKSAKDARMAPTQDDRLGLNKTVGLAKATQRQARKNLNTAMNCVTDFVLEDDEDSKLVKNDLYNMKLLHTLANIAFFREPDASENVLSTRVSAFRTISGLIRGHDNFRQAFADEQCRDGPGSDNISMQVATMNAMLRDSSAAIRVAAYTTLRDSFIADSGLNMPSSSLLNALVNAGGLERYSSSPARKLSRSFLSPGHDSQSPDSPANFIATTLKEVLVGYPSVSDAAAVFYAASFISWVLRALRGAKEQLLNTHVRGSLLLPQVIRVLGKLERERGAPEVRISLFALVCEWLYGSSMAVSAFLSSAMHLPMLVDSLRSAGSRGDIAEVHTRGLSAVILGICLRAADVAEDAATEGSILSGTRGPPVVIPKGAVPDVIRNRIGITAFTACLDDLRATKAFSTTSILELPWKSAEELVLLEARNGLLSASGSAGHENWYSKNMVELVNVVYQSVGEKVLDLVADSNQGAVPSARGGANTLSMNGHASVSASQEAKKSIIADSARDEVINSYKEFIRKQDESLNAAKHQIEELTAALRQAQLELDKHSGGTFFPRDSDPSLKADEERHELLAQKEALEGLLEEKTADFEALSNAFATLEAEHNAASQEYSTERGEELAADMQRLRTQNESLKNSLDTERHKNEELSRHASVLDESMQLKDVELTALASERDSLKKNARPELVEALQWRTRAEVAESKIHSRQQLIDSYQSSNAALQDQLRENECAHDEALASVTSLTKKFNSTKSELDSLRATRRVELQISRETSAASDASAKNEIASLKEQLAEAKQKFQKEIAEKAKGPSPAELGRFEQMQTEYQAIVNAYEKMKTELMDAKQAVVQWQKRTETSEAARQREGADNNRVIDHARSLEGQLKELNDALLAQKQTSEASTTRVSELEEQCKEIDEIRKHTEEELIVLKEQLASRTEQSIRLSGQLYELEESKEKLEEEIETMRATVASGPVTRDDDAELLQSRDAAGYQAVDPKVEELQARVAELQEELKVTRDALADSKDRESLSQAHARDRDAMVAKIDLLEQNLSATRDAKEKMETDVSSMKERLLSLDEAEESKRALTMEVVSLQEALAAMEKHSTSPARNESLDHNAERIRSLEAEREQLRKHSDEKDMRLEGLESSLTLALERSKFAEREKKDMEKQVSETEAMFSVLRSERDSLMKEKEALQETVDELSPLAEADTSRLEEVQSKLADAEKMRDAVSEELASLVAAVRMSERESRQLRDDSVKANKSLVIAKRELSKMQDECRKVSLSRNVDDVISNLLVDVSLVTQGSAARQVVDTLRLERNQAVADLETSQTELEDALSEMTKLPLLVKERDEAVARTKEQESLIATLSQDLVGLQLIAKEKDMLASSLGAAKTRMDELNEEKVTLVTALEKANAQVEELKDASPECTNGDKEPAEEIAIQNRVQELEEALRDAAKTVTATNSELIAAQSLLVDLSADKTAMRTELSSAQEKISDLAKQVANLSRSSQAAPAMSEVSEQEHGFGEDTSVLPESVIGELTNEGALQSTQAEASNLRMALQRSMTEADSATNLVSSIETRIAEIEAKLKESRITAVSAQETSDALKVEVQRLQEFHRSEEDSFERDTDRFKARIRDLESEVEQTKEIWKETLSMSEESWSAERGNLENELTDLRNKLNESTEECSNLQNEVERTVQEFQGAKDILKELEVSKLRLSSSVEQLDEERSRLRERLEKSTLNEKSLKDSLHNTQEELQSERDLLERNRKSLEEQHQAEVKDLEEELDRASSSMERAERAFRNSEASLKEQITQERSNLRHIEQQQKQAQESLRAARADIRRISHQKDQLETNLADTIRRTDLEITAVKAERNDVRNSLTVSREECVHLRNALRDTEETMRITKRDLEEETEQKVLLESENQDFLSTIESLESTSKRIRSELIQKTKDLSQAEERVGELQSNLSDRAGRVKDMEREITDKNSEIRQLIETKTKLENLSNELYDNLKSTEESRDSLAQDNKDLLAWVSDLEKRATGLQSAASDFQEVEQNLRDALESQRYACEQNSKLAEELKKERTSLSTAQASVFQLEREKEAAHVERDSSKRRVQEVEARIRQIREENLVKYSQSEEVIRTKAKQCAELETALATSERKVAELESVSDDLFGATTSLKQLHEEVSTLRERAVSAEDTAQALRKELQAAKAEVSEIREHSSGEALRSLEAEHNELLVYLADLELEVTNLRDELGRE